MTNKNNLLSDVVVIRPLIIVLVVLTHSLAIYSGAWEPIEGYKPVEFYWWLSKFLQCFCMPAIIFIAGYVYGYQVLYQKKEYPFIKFAKNKFKRLIIPSIFFSVIYFFMFYYNENDFSLSNCIISILSGCGHLWFLPMLFWGFLALNLVSKLKINVLLLTIIFIGLSLLPLNIPFGIGSFLHYFIYIYLGFLTYKYKDSLINKVCNLSFIGVNTIIFFILFFIITIYSITLDDSLKLATNVFDKGINYLQIRILSLTLGVYGILMVYIIANYFTSIKKIIPANFVYESSKICYGIYIYHQFLLVIIYYHTSLPLILNEYLLPIFSFILVLMTTIIMTKATLKTKFGRYLVG